MPDRERNCTAKNRVRELRSPGSVRDEGSNVLVYSDTAAKDACCAFGDDTSYQHGAPVPRMPAVKNYTPLGNMGVLLLGCVYGADLPHVRV